MCSRNRFSTCARLALLGRKPPTRRRKLKGLYWVYTDEYRIVGAPFLDPESSIGQRESNEDTQVWVELGRDSGVFGIHAVRAGRSQGAGYASSAVSSKRARRAKSAEPKSAGCEHAGSSEPRGTAELHGWIGVVPARRRKRLVDGGAESSAGDRRQSMGG